LPAIDETGWTEIEREPHAAGPDDEFGTIFRVLDRN
jgi:hypothetical protein